MEGKSMLAPVCFAALAIFVGLASEFGIELMGIAPTIARPLSLYLFAIPIALAVARRIGRVGRLPLLIASAAVSAFFLALVAYIMTNVVAPGSPLAIRELFVGPEGTRNVLSVTATLLVPQLWLSLLSRMSANNSSKPTPLRGAA